MMLRYYWDPEYLGPLPAVGGKWGLVVVGLGLVSRTRVLSWFWQQRGLVR